MCQQQLHGEVQDEKETYLKIINTDNSAYKGPPNLQVRYLKIMSHGL